VTECHNPEDTILYSHHCKKPQISNSTYSIYSVDGNHPQYPEMKHSINLTISAICTVHATSHVNMCCDLHLCFLDSQDLCSTHKRAETLRWKALWTGLFSFTAMMYITKPKL